MQYIQSENGPGEQKQAVVVIDPGHGGTDPGKVGIDGQLEKDINLAVAKKLKTYLEVVIVKCLPEMWIPGCIPAKILIKKWRI